MTSHVIPDKCPICQTTGKKGYYQCGVQAWVDGLGKYCVSKPTPACDVIIEIRGEIESLNREIETIQRIRQGI